jgi:hypothetical protein
MLGRDASTVLSVMETAEQFCQTPTESTVIPLRCLAMGSETCPEYYGIGLSTSALDKLIQIVTPSLFAKLEFWQLRGLSSKDILLSKDLSEVDAGML